jgi:hypothetical protein
MKTKVQDRIAFTIAKGEFEFELIQVDQSKFLIKAIFASEITNSD